MWLKILFTTLLFYLLTLIQNSFFVHFNILGVVPNFIFILFFILVFFSSHKGLYSWEDLFYSIIAGFFIDIFTYSHFGISFVLLSIIAVIAKKLLSSLRQRKDKHSIVYFVPLFLIFLTIYDVLSISYWNIDWALLIKIIYSCIFAVIGFYIYKKTMGSRS